MITAGEVLKNKRELLKKSLEKVSLDTKIQKRFLQYIENNQFNYFDSEVFLTGFIKIYAQYLELDTNKILALYRRSNPPKNIPQKQLEKREPIVKTNNKKILKIFTPKNLVAVLLSLFLLLVVGYIGFQIYKFQSPPQISITQPVNEQEFNEEKVTVSGNTETEALVEINGTSVEPDSEGNFEKEITLNEGANVITVRARKNNSLEKVETIKVTYLIPSEEQQEQDQQEEVLVNIIRLEVFDSPAWIKLDIDGENKLSQVVEPENFEFEIQQDLYVITGRLGNTRIYFNDQLLNWQTGQTTGVAELTCTIQQESLVCNQ